MKSVYDLCKNYMMNKLYLVHTLIYNMDIYKTPKFTKFLSYDFHHYRKLLFIDKLLPLWNLCK